MRLKHALAMLSLLLWLAMQHLNASAIEVSLVDFERKPKQLILIGTDAVSAKVEWARANGIGALRINFSNDDERRFFGIEMPLKVKVSGNSLVLVYRSKLSQADILRACIIAFDGFGNAWFKRTLPLPITNEFVESRISLSGFTPAAFARHPERGFSINNISKLWVGFIVDGKSSGTVELSRISLTDEPYKPTEPLPVPLVGNWRLVKDPAVKAQLSLIHDGTPPMPCMKVEFLFPIGRHMYLLPIIPVVHESELSDYKALQFTYRAELPDGISGLLVCLWEKDGSQYYADPSPPASQEWRTVTIPFSAFKLGGWSSDENGQLDLNQVESIVIGAHGTAKGKDGSGFIIARALKFVP